MNITTNVASLNWRTNTKGTWKALVKDLSPNTAVTFSDSFTGVVTGKQIAVESPTMPTGFITYTTDDTNVVVGGALYGAGTAYDSVEAVTGEKTVRMGSVDLGTLSWIHDSYHRFYASVSGKASGIFNLVCYKYVTTSISGASLQDKEIAGNASNTQIYIKDLDLDELTSTEFQNSLSGVYLYYELATPTTSTDTTQPMTITSGDNTFGGGSFDVTYEGMDYSIPLGKTCKYIHRFPDGTEELLTGSSTVTSVNVTGAQDKLINLTHWFGKGKEPSINDFYKLYPTWKFYDIPYDSGTILNYKGTGIQTIGFNAYDHSTGTAVLLGGNRYQICGTYTSCSYVDQWGNAETLEIDANGIFTPVNNGTLTVVGGNNTDTCVHLVWSGYKNYGEPEYKHEEYVKHDKSFPIATYFPDGMNGIGDTYDELTSDSAIQRIGIKKLTGQESIGTAGYSGKRAFNLANIVGESHASGIICNIAMGLADALEEGFVWWASAANMGIVLPWYLYDEITTVEQFTDYLEEQYNNGTPVCILYVKSTSITTSITDPLNLTYPVNDFGTEQSLPINTPTLLSTDLNADIKYSQDFTRLLVHYSDMYPTVKTLVEDEPNLMRKDDVAPNATVGNAYNLIDRNATGTERQFSFDTAGGIQDIADGTAVAKKLMGTTLNLNQLVHDTNENTVNSVNDNATVTDAVEGNVKHLVVSGDTVVVNQLVKENVEKTETGVDRIWIKDAVEGAAKGLKITAPRSVVMNQQVDLPSISATLNGVTLSNMSASTIRCYGTATSTSSASQAIMPNGFTLADSSVLGHVIIVKATGIKQYISYQVFSGTAWVILSNDSHKITMASSNVYNKLLCIPRLSAIDEGTVVDESVEFSVVDLTQYFNGNTTLIDSIQTWDDLVAYDSAFASYVQYNTGTVKGVQPALTLNGAAQPFVTSPQEMFGVGTVGDEYSVVDGKYTQKVCVHTFDGTENWWMSSTGVFKCYVSSLTPKPKYLGVGICTKPKYQNWPRTNMPDMSWSISESNTSPILTIKDTSIETLEDFKASIAGGITFVMEAQDTAFVVTDDDPITFNLVSHDNTIFQTSGALKSTIEATYDGLNQTIMLDPTHTYIINHQYVSDSIITNESSIDVIGTEDNLVDLTQLYNGDSTRISAIHSWASLSSKIHMYRDWLPYIPGEIVNLAATIRVYQHEYAYGVIYDPSKSSPACQKVELHDGVLTQVEEFSSLPVHDKFYRCVMDDLANRHINYYLDDTDSTKKYNGTRNGVTSDGSTSVLTGADGDVMVEMPITHWSIDEDYNGEGKILWLISDQPFTGSEIHPYFYVSPNGDTPRVQYVGAYRAVGCDENGNALNTTEGAITQITGTTSTRLLRSVSGALPWVSSTLASMRTDAVRHGGTMVNRLFHEYLFLMIIIEQASLNCQSVSLGYSNGKTNALWAWRKSGRVNYGNGTGEILATSGTTDDDNFYSLKVNNVQLYRDTVRGANNYYAWSNHASTPTVYWTASATPSNGDTAYSDTEGTSSGYTVTSWSTTSDANKIIQFQYRGIENPWGECWEFDDGMQKYQKSVLKAIKVNNVTYYVNHLKDGTGTKTAWTTEDDSDTVWTTTVTPSNNTATYSDAECTVSTGHNLTQSSFTRMDCELWSTQVTNDYTSTDQHTTGTKVYDMKVNYWPVGSWIKKFDPRTFLCLVNGGNGSQYLCDNWYNDNGTGSRVVYRGGAANGGANDGLGCVNVGSGLTASYVAISGRLSA